MGLSPLQRLTCPVRCVFRLGWKHDQVLFSGHLACTPTSPRTASPPLPLSHRSGQTPPRTLPPRICGVILTHPGCVEKGDVISTVFTFFSLSLLWINACRGKVHQWLCIHIYIFNLPWLCWTLVNCWDRVGYLIRSRRLRFYS